MEPPDRLVLTRQAAVLGPFATEAEALAAGHGTKGSFGYGNVAPELSFLFRQGRKY